MAESVDILAQAKKVANNLQHTCQTLLGSLATLELPEELQDNKKFTEELDSLVFCCTECGWWEGIEEDSGNCVCFDCSPDYTGM